MGGGGQGGAGAGTAIQSWGGEGLPPSSPDQGYPPVLDGGTPGYPPLPSAGWVYPPCHGVQSENISFRHPSDAGGN